jgi:hypothetical protein
MIVVPRFLGGTGFASAPSWATIERAVAKGGLAGKAVITPLDLQRVVRVSEFEAVTLILEARKESAQAAAELDENVDEAAALLSGGAGGEAEAAAAAAGGAGSGDGGTRGGAASALPAHVRQGILDLAALVDSPAAGASGDADAVSSKVAALHASLFGGGGAGVGAGRELRLAETTASRSSDPGGGAGSGSARI